MMALQRASDQPPSGPPVASGMEEGGPPMEDPSFILESMASALEQIAQAMPESAQRLNTAIEILRSVSASKPPQSVPTSVPLPNVLGSNVARLNAIPEAIGRVIPEPFSEFESKRRASQFDSDYFNGGKRIGGYVKEGYKDFDSNEIAAANVLRMRPNSILELGCGRGYTLKRFQDADCPSMGIEISKYAWMTRVADAIKNQDVCSPWGLGNGSVDLCFSLNLLEHIPEQHLQLVCEEMMRVCKRGLHGVSFTEPENDQTVCTIRPKDWWIERFASYAPGFPVQIVDANELKTGQLPQEYMYGV